MTKLLTLKKMKKKLVLLTLILALSTLVGCNKEHTHKFKQAYDDEVHYMECKCGEREDGEYLHQLEWVNAEDINTATLQCSTCGWVYDFDKMFAKPVTAEPMSYGDMPSIRPVISYRISAGSGKYDVGEEIEITLLLRVNDNRILDGSFHVKLAESPYYEIVDKNEHIIPDFCKSDYAQNPEIEFKFKIKATAPCDIPSRFEFKIKFNANHEKYEGQYIKSSNSEGYYDNSEEYFITVRDLCFVTNSENIFISENVQDIFYSTTNHEYINGTITKDEYIARVTEYLYYGSAAVKRYDDNHYSYYSRNIRAFFTLGDDYEYLSSCFDNNNSDDPYFEGYLSAANDLLDILLENNLVSNAEYEIEKTYLSENGVRNARNSRYLVENLIPFYSDYEARIEEMTIQCVDSALYDCNNHGGNSASLYLPEHKIPVGSEINLTVYTNFSQSLNSLSINVEDGFSLASNFSIENNCINFTVEHNITNTAPHYSMDIVLDDTSFTLNLYGYVQKDYIYLSQWSYDEAYNTFLSYENPDPTISLYAIREHCELYSNQSSEYSLVANTLSVFDTSISGELYWQDDDYNNHPLQYSLVELWDREPDGATLLKVTWTNSNGFYTFLINNDLSEDEGGYDPYVKILSAGQFITVCNSMNECYHKEIHLPDNITSGEWTDYSWTYGMDEHSTTSLFGKALQIAQSSTIASLYYYKMSGTTNGNVTVIYPHNEAKNSCYYAGNGVIKIVGNLADDNSLHSYSSWDVIMHEYGHYVADKEGIKKSPGSGHYIDVDMAEHYMHHFASQPVPDEPNMNCILQKEPDKFTAEECKQQGEYLAWSEGFASYFSLAAQQYAIENLFLSTNINTVGNTEYNSYKGANYDIEDIDINVDMDVEISDSNEITIHAILYDMYDSSTEIHDSIELGHQTMWNLIVNSKAKTFDEFDDYFLIHCTNATDLEKYNKLLSSHHLAPSNVRVTNGVTTYCPTFTWSWTEQNSTAFFDDRTYSLNFYDSNRSLIATTEEFTCTNNSYTISESLWQTILDNGTSFYVSVTIYENHDPKTDYEGEWKEFYLPIIEASVDTNMSKYLSTDDCYWYKFVAPETGEYEFKTTGSTDTIAEIFDRPVVAQSYNGIRSTYDGGGDANNFLFTRYLIEGESIYIRIIGNNWTSTGVYSFVISPIEHIHNYTHHYASKGMLGHSSYCACGEYITEMHEFYASNTENYCLHCGFVSQGGSIIRPYKKENEEELL